MAADCNLLTTIRDKKVNEKHIGFFKTQQYLPNVERLYYSLPL